MPTILPSALPWPTAVAFAVVIKAVIIPMAKTMGNRMAKVIGNLMAIPMRKGAVILVTKAVVNPRVIPMIKVVIKSGGSVLCFIAFGID